MGEPLAPSVGQWFSKKFLNKNKPIVNTYFQTETGGIISSPSFSDNIGKSPHGSVGSLTSSKIRITNLYQKKKRIKIINNWQGVWLKLKMVKWDKYWDYQKNFRMFDFATKKENYIIIHGRVDDVINIRGHRIGSEEIESKF